MSPKLKSTVVKTPQLPPKRRRTKKLHRDLLEQLEFYLSEANLRHDPFMKEKAGEKGINDVSIQLFLSFPLIQEMDVTEKNILSALENSRILQLSENRRHIHRKYPVPRPPHNLEQSTLYIENLPPDATTEWLKEVCQKIGAVRYVSLPRYKRTGRIKGFAFVEFSSPEDVSRACRIFQDPPKNFFPNRTDKYLRRMNRIKNIHQTSEQQTPATTSQPDSSKITPTSESCLLNKSLDSAVDFERLGQAHGTPTTSIARKRKRRRSRCTSSSATAIQPDKTEEVTPTHTPAKKLKSLPVNSNHEAFNEKISNNSRENSNKNNPVSMTTKKKQCRKVNFSIAEDGEDQKSSKVLKNSDEKREFCQNCGKNSELDKNKTEIFKTENKDAHNDVINGIPCDVKIEVYKDSGTQCDDCGQNPLNKSSSKTSENDQNSQKDQTVSSDIEQTKLIGVKRRRSASEPPGIHEVCAGNIKKTKEESSDQSDANSEQSSPVKIVTLDINQLIAHGRQKAQASEIKPLPPNIAPKRVMQSVIAKPSSQVKKKSRQRSRRSKERRKIRTRQVPPKLTVMPKVDWSELKIEYKKLQKQNMSKLKKTIRENKAAGSVFIKKHLDVLNDVNISNEWINSDLSDNEESAKNNPDALKHKLLKRGPPTFQPGVIVRISANQTTLDLSGEPRPSKLPAIEEIKSRLNKYGQGVAYVDINPEESAGFVRFNDGDSAQRAILEERTLALCLLTGQLEEQYWERLLASRARKFARERPKVRGRTKILAKAENLVEKAKRRHIRFDNDLTA